MAEEEICPLVVRARETINWKICVLCLGNKTKEKLINPCNNPSKHCDEGYNLLSKNLTAFNDLKELPFSIVLNDLNCGDGLKASFLRHHAVWHKSCYLKCNNSKRQKAEERASRKRSQESDILMQSASGPSHVKTRRHQDTVYDVNTCIICSLPEARLLPLGAVLTENCNKKLIYFVTLLSDFKL